MKISFAWKVLVTVIVLFAISGRETSAENFNEVLKDKMPIAQGVCYFKGEKFLAFATGTWMFPKGFMDKAEHCFVFAEDSKLDPVWLVFFDKKGFPNEVIKWDDSLAGSPAEFTSVWKPEEEKTKPMPVKRDTRKETEI